MPTLRDLSDLLTADPVTLAAALMMAAAVLALVLLVAPGRTQTAGRSATLRPARARSLAAAGTAPREIARRTGLSHDAVAILLGSGATVKDRKGRPLPAPFSAPAKGKRPTAPPAPPA